MFSQQTIGWDNKMPRGNNNGGSKWSDPPLRLIQDQGQVREAFLTKAFNLEIRHIALF